jgi:PAS domain S-box-containing protein
VGSFALVWVGHVSTPTGLAGRRPKPLRARSRAHFGIVGAIADRSGQRTASRASAGFVANHENEEKPKLPCSKSQRFERRDSDRVCVARRTRRRAHERIPHDAYRPTFVKSLAMTPIGTPPVAAIGAYWASQHRANERELALLRGIAGACAVALVNVEAIASLTKACQDAEAAHTQTRALFDSMPQLGWAARPDGYVDFYSRGWYEYSGKTQRELQGWGWASVHDAEALPRVIERWNYSLEHGSPFEMEYKLRRRDGAMRWFLTRVNPLRDSHGAVIRWIGISSSIRSCRARGRPIGPVADWGSGSPWCAASSRCTAGR